MASDNRISLQVTPAQKAAIDDAIAALKTSMAGLLINLTPEEKSLKGALYFWPKIECPLIASCPLRVSQNTYSPDGLRRYR